MNIGAMRHVVDVMGFRSQKDSTNQDVKAEYTKARSVPCSIETVSGGEVRRGRQMQGATSVLIEMHHPQGAFEVTPEDKLMFGKRTIYVVAAYDPNEGRRVLQIQGRENA